MKCITYLQGIIKLIPRKLPVRSAETELFRWRRQKLKPAHQFISPERVKAI